MNKYEKSMHLIYETTLPIIRTGDHELCKAVNTLEELVAKTKWHSFDEKPPKFKRILLAFKKGDGAIYMCEKWFTGDGEWNDYKDENKNKIFPLAWKMATDIDEEFLKMAIDDGQKEEMIERPKGFSVIEDQEVVERKCNCVERNTILRGRTMKTLFYCLFKALRVTVFIILIIAVPLGILYGIWWLCSLVESTAWKVIVFLTICCFLFLFFAFLADENADWLIDLGDWFVGK